MIAAPEPIRARFRGQKLPGMLATAAGLRTHASWDVETNTTIVALRSLARRHRALTQEAAEHRKAIMAIVRAWRPDLLDQLGVGPIVAATVLCAWSHPGRIHSEAAFAMLAGVAPIPANSGQVTNRYRLNRYGDRQLNRALHVIVQSRIRYDNPTRDYVARRTTQGKTGREIKRCLSRYIARPLPPSRKRPHDHLTNRRSVACPHGPASRQMSAFPRVRILRFLAATDRISAPVCSRRR